MALFSRSPCFVRNRKKKSIQDQVVVITGASSGIGRQTALAFGRAGATLVLAARGGDALEEVTSEVQALGVPVRLVIADVSRAEQVERLADEAMSTFGRIDTWINNAGVGQWARFADHSLAEIDQIIATNLLGTMYGTKAALSRMHGGGTIINIGSVESERAIPLQSVYAASKHAVKGFTDALRVELHRDKSPVDVVLIMPTFIDTPLYEHSGAKLGGVEPRPIPPLYAPSAVADAVLFAAEHPTKEIVIGGSGKVFEVLDRFVPNVVEGAMKLGGAMFKLQRSGRPKTVPANLFQSSEGYRVRGGYGGFERSRYTRTVEQHPVVKRAILVGAVTLVVAALVRRR